MRSEASLLEVPYVISAKLDLGFVLSGIFMWNTTYKKTGILSYTETCASFIHSYQVSVPLDFNTDHHRSLFLPCWSRSCGPSDLERHARLWLLGFRSSEDPKGLDE